MPYCTLNYVSKIAAPGDTYLFKNGRYGDGPTMFTRSGSAAAPITYKAIGTDVVIGSFEDVRDEDFQATQYPHVFSINKINPSPRGYLIYQTYFDPIVVDDPNASIFTMRQEDGPIGLTKVNDYTTLSNIQGTWLADATAGKIYVHAHGNRVPSIRNTDLVFAHGAGALAMESYVEYNIFDGFRVTYSSGNSFVTLGRNSRFLNLKFQSIPWQLRGSNNYAENISISHVIARGASWQWYDSGSGTAMAVAGTGHRLHNLHFFHNWNSSISTENARAVVIDGLRSHGAPNHCGSAGSNNIVRNVVQYNCQDYFYWAELENVVIEQAVVPTGITLQAINAPMGRITVRNSILGGGIAYSPSVSKAITCAWEAGSIFENNIIPSKATIRHCEDHKDYTFPDYVSKCESGLLTNCMTVRGNILVTDFKAVIKDGMWNAALADTWDATLVPSSPAIDRGTVSGATTDILGVARPRGSAFDIGAFEFCARGCPTSFPIETSAPVPTETAAPSNLRILP